MSVTVIKPCPFCNSTNLHMDYEGNNSSGFDEIRCKDCGAIVTFGKKGDCFRGIDIMQWNTRPIPVAIEFDFNEIIKY